MRLPPPLRDQIGPAPVVVFDGECVLCSGFFRFLIKHDHDRRFRFVVAQSPLGDRLYQALGMSTEVYESNLVIIGGRVHTKARAFAAAMWALGAPWAVLAVTGWPPARITDPLYMLIARNRYRWFGRFDSCMIPDADIRTRFLPGGWG